jgi:hypothetical protein
LPRLPFVERGSGARAPPVKPCIERCTGLASNEIEFLKVYGSLPRKQTGPNPHDVIGVGFTEQLSRTLRVLGAFRVPLWQGVSQHEMSVGATALVTCRLSP